MRLIQITDLQNFTFNVNPNQVTRVEEYPKSNKIIVFLSDGFGIQTNTTLTELLKLINS
jgi:hypothetical protein